MKWRIRLD